ncbi:MAG: hypothetical protein AMXMBFR33_57370 [Candidatus Xenobia bacterium]|jgi:hypothetical protein
MLDESESGLKNQKLDPALREMADDPTAPELLTVIIQTVDGLKDDDRRMVSTLRGTVKDDLYIINAFSADVPRSALNSLILSPRVVRIYNDSEIRGA